MSKPREISFITTLILIFLLPLFFLPASVLSLGSTKILLLALGVIVAFVTILVDVMRAGKISLPATRFLWSVPLIPVVYFFSSYLGTDKTKSIFGYEMEVGTFGFMLLVSVLFGIVAYLYDERGKILRALGAFFLSFVFLVLFALVKLLSGGHPVWGTFAGNMGNPVGVWTDYSIAFGMLSIFSVLALTILPGKKLMKIVMSLVLAVSLVLTAIINFSTSWILLLVVSVIFLVYLMTTEKRIRLIDEEHSVAGKVMIWPTVLLLAVSLIFVINPKVSSTSGGIANTISNAFEVANVDVRPAFTTTINISKQALDKNPILGSGPNTFDQDWLLYKPQEVNASTFWNVSFPFGFGFLPTQIASTGAVGSVLWLAFLIFFLILGARSLSNLPKDAWSRFALMSTFLTSFFLWTASFMYVPSRTILALAFIFTGLFLASARTAGVIGTREIVFSGRPVTNFAAVLLVIVLGIGSAGLALTVFQRTVSAFHFQRAVVLSNTEGSSVDDVQEEILKAINMVPHDIYYRALSQLNVARAQSLLTATTGTQEENQQKFQTAVSDSIASAQLAVNTNPKNYENWIGLGSIYSSLVPSPFSVDGAYEAAMNAYLEAKKINPTSPEIPLLIARLELSKENVGEARKHIQASLALKADYADAYLLLTQLELGENNVAKAIESAEATAFLSPNNAGVFLQLGLLKYTTEDWTGARDAFSRALVILPDYANAKYYLGLTYNKLEDNERAIILFKDLMRTNPDNEEIKIILSNLEAGQDPLMNLPTETREVEDRTELPL